MRLVRPHTHKCGFEVELIKQSSSSFLAMVILVSLGIVEGLRIRKHTVQLDTCRHEFGTLGSSTEQKKNLNTHCQLERF